MGEIAIAGPACLGEDLFQSVLQGVVRARRSWWRGNARFTKEKERTRDGYKTNGFESLNTMFRTSAFANRPILRMQRFYQN